MNESSPVPEPSPDEAKTGLDIHQILQILPHRYPLLLITATKSWFSPVSNAPNFAAR